VCIVCCKFLMYPVLKITRMLNFLGTFSIGVTFYVFIFVEANFYVSSGES
jgi:hypothetical protein